MSFNVGHFEKVRALAATPKYLFLGGVRAGEKSTISVLNLTASKVAHTLELPTHCLGLAVAGDTLAAAGADGGLWLFPVDEKKDGRRVSAHVGSCTAVASSKDGARFATAGTDGALRLFDSSGKKLHEWSLSAQALRAVAIDPAGEHLAAAGDDGVVRSVHLPTNAVREMAGHNGPVYALSFTPRDGRLLSGGDDGTLRIWYLVGPVEAEVRGSDETGHKGAVLAALFVPTPEGKGKEEPSDRFFSAGADGVVKSWRLEDKRKPKTVNPGEKAVAALAFIPPANASAAKSSLGSLAISGDDRTVWSFSLETDGAFSSDYSDDDFEDGFSLYSSNITSYSKPTRETAVKALAPLEEHEALELVLKALRSDRDADVRALAVKLVGEYKRRDAKGALRERLEDDNAGVRRAALEALRAIDGQESLSPLRAALSSRYSDLRKEALGALVALKDTSPLVAGLITDALKDRDGSVRFTALDKLSLVLPEVAALKAAFASGVPSDLGIEALVRAVGKGLTPSAELAPLVARALDDKDNDAELRRLAFAARVLERRALAALLEEKDEDVERAIKEIVRRLAVRAGIKEKNPSEDELKAARQSIPGVGEPGAELSEQDLEPLLIAMSCRTPDTALRGARGLAKLGDTRALGALLQLSREAQAPLRREAALALKELKDPRAKKRLLWMLDDKDAAVRAAALDAYSKLEGSASLQIAEASLRSGHEDIRVRGLERLMKVGPEGKKAQEAAQLLEDAIEDESQKVRGEAFRTLWAWNEKEPRAVIDRVLLARFPDLRLLAVAELERLGKEGWAEERLRKTIGDRDAAVASAAYEAVLKLKGKDDTEAHLAALASMHASVRQKGAKGAEKSDLDKSRPALLKIVSEDEEFTVRKVALETLDALFPEDVTPLQTGLGATHADYRGRMAGVWSIRVRAAELLAARRSELPIEILQNFLADKEPFKWLPLETLRPLRERAATALASIGATRLVRYFSTELLKDEYPEVREQAARGLATAARKGDEVLLLDALGHQDVWVRSWAADGLSRLGDTRALPVLTGTLHHEHLPIRFSATISFAALGPEGYGGMLQGLEDATKEVQELIFAIVLARDLDAFRNNQPPELLTSALSSQRSDVRYAAARALELRASTEDYLAYVVGVLMPPQPEKASEMKDWPVEEERARLMAGLAEALASESPDLRYAAASALRLRNKPLDYFKEAQRLARPRSSKAPVVPDTAPRGRKEGDTAHKGGWLRRLFTHDRVEGEKRSKSQYRDLNAEVPDTEQLHLRRLAFGAYVGLLRQAVAGDEEGHRVRREAVSRIVDLGQHGGIGLGAALPPVLRALDDPNHLVRQAAYKGLRELLREQPDEPLRLALLSTATDIAKEALDELAARGVAAKPQITAALSSPQGEVRRYAFELLERLSPKGSLEPLLAALGSEHADLRVGVIERLAHEDDSRVTEALVRSLTSDHDDLRLRAAELLAERRDSRAAEVLGAFLRGEDKASAGRALKALARLRGSVAVRVLGARLDEVRGAAKIPYLKAVGRTRSDSGIELLLPFFEEEAEDARREAFEAALEISKKEVKNLKLDEDDPEHERLLREATRDANRAIRVLRAAAKAKDVQLRLRAAGELDVCEEVGQNEALVGLFGDREKDVRSKAVESYAYRVRAKQAPLEPLLAVLQKGTRELVLPAAEGVAWKKNSAALRPLLLVVRAGEDHERPRAALALGSLGDVRALAELETLAAGGTEDAPVEGPLKAAAVEALGRLAPSLTDNEARGRVIEKLEALATDASDRDLQTSAIVGLRHLGGERARTKLEALLTSTEYNRGYEREQACRELGLLGDVASEKALAGALGDNHYSVPQAAKKALLKLFPNDKTRVEYLVLEAGESDLLEEAVRHLSTAGDPGRLLPRLAHIDDEELRQKIRFGLVRRESLPTEALAGLLTNDSAAARQEAAWLIGTRGGDANSYEKQLVEGVSKSRTRWADEPNSHKKNEEALALQRILWAGWRVGASGLLPQARAVLAGGDKFAPVAARREALAVLVTLGGAAEKNALAEALKDASSEVRSAAASALRTLAPDAVALALAVKPFDPSSFGRAVKDGGPIDSAAARSLVLPKLLARGESAALVALAKDGAEADRLDAISALGRVGSAEGIEFLRTIAFDKKAGDANTRKAAYRALKCAQRKAAKKAKRAEVQS